MFLEILLGTIYGVALVVGLLVLVVGGGALIGSLIGEAMWQVMKNMEDK